MSVLEANGCVTLTPDEVEELHWVLGILEDWLLHASDEALAELGDFVADQSGDLALVGTLGRYSRVLRRRGEGDQR